jgi:hypothetical protein
MGSTCSKIIQTVNPEHNMIKYIIHPAVYALAKREKILWLRNRKLIASVYSTKDMLILIPINWPQTTHERILHSITPGVYHSPYDRTFYRQGILPDPPTHDELEKLFTPAPSY